MGNIWEFFYEQYEYDLYDKSPYSFPVHLFFICLTCLARLPVRTTVLS